MEQDLTNAQKRRRMFIADWNHLALIGAVIVTVWGLVTALLAIEVFQFPAQLQQTYEQGQSRGRLDSLEEIVSQHELRLQTTELTLGLRAKKPTKEEE